MERLKSRMGALVLEQEGKSEYTVKAAEIQSLGNSGSGVELH